MSEQTSHPLYNSDPIVRPGANLIFFSWLLLFGLPALLLFLIFSKHAG